MEEENRFQQTNNNVLGANAVVSIIYDTAYTLPGCNGISYKGKQQEDTTTTTMKDEECLQRTISNECEADTAVSDIGTAGRHQEGTTTATMENMHGSMRTKSIEYETEITASNIVAAGEQQKDTAIATVKDEESLQRTISNECEADTAVSDIGTTGMLQEDKTIDNVIAAVIDSEYDERSEVTGTEAEELGINEENRITSFRHFDDHDKDVNTRLVTKDSKRFGPDKRTDSVSDSNVPKKEPNRSLKKDISDRNQSPYDWQSEVCGDELKYSRDDSDSKDDIMNMASEKDLRLIMEGKQQGDDASSDNDTWRIDTDVWKKCIETENEHEAMRLVKSRIIPDQDLLDRASEVFGIYSDTIHNICTAICCYVKENVLHTIKVCAALDYRNECTKKQIIFIIYTSKSSETETTDYRCFKRSVNEISTSCDEENRKVKELEEKLSKDYSETDKIRECLDKHSKSLMEQHTNLTRVSISWFKSIGYGTHEQSITQNICIAFYVQVKGYVPLHEAIFPKVIDGIDIDVREGVVLSYAGRAEISEHDERLKIGCKLKMGCAVQCELNDKYGNSLIGTLGWFFKLGKDTFCISSAHTFLSAEDMEKLKDSEISDLTDFTKIKSFEACQSVLDEAIPFGVGVRAVYKEGGNGETGVEVVIIKVQDRLPISGEFPDCPNRRNPGFDSPDFSSGKMCNREEVSRLIRNKTLTVVKFGCSSGWTRGRFRFDGGSARLSHMDGTVQDFGILLYNQFEIESIGDTHFAEYGDSGALVFTEENNELSAIGIVEGGMAGIAYVTPISEVFTALDIQGVQNMKKMSPNCRDIQNKPMQSPASHPSRQLINRTVSDVWSVGETTLHNVDGILETLKQLHGIKNDINESINQDLGPVKDELYALKSGVSVLTSDKAHVKAEVECTKTELKKDIDKSNTKLTSTMYTKQGQTREQTELQSRLFPLFAEPLASKTSVPANETESNEDTGNAFLTRFEAIEQSVTETRNVANQTLELQQIMSQRMTAVEQHLQERQPPSHLSKESDLDVSRTFKNNLSYVCGFDHETPKSGRRNDKDRDMSSEKESEKMVHEVNRASGGDPGCPPSDGTSKDDKSNDGRSDKKNKNKISHTDKTGKAAKQMIIDAAAWTICLDQESNFENEASSLLDQGKMPDQALLNKICSKYTRFWPHLRNICDGICSFIKQKSDKIVHVWPAYQYKNDDRVNGKEIVFVVLTVEPGDIELSDFSTYIRCIFDVSSKKENREIKNKESNDRPSSEGMKDLEKCLKENARELMERYSKLTRVTASWFKSRGHDTDEFSLRKEHCIALYVHVKGFIPLHEEPFPKKVGNYPVDVREGIFTLCGGPNDYHKNVKMGCAIRGGLNKGTLGAFVEFENDNCVYGITSAHVVFTWDELRKLMEEGQMQFQYPNTQTVYQPYHETFGSTVAAVYRAGGNGIPGMEIAVVEIRQDRWPTDGTFPDDLNHAKLGFGPHRPFVFCSGKMDQLSNLKHSPVVYKYGGESGITKGLYRVDGASVRTQTFRDNILGTELVMHDQIEIESVGTDTFGEHGDSGALVVTNEQGNSELFAVGIFEGKMSDEDVYTVTPICSVLDELRRLTNKQCVLKRFPQHNSIFSYPGHSGGENVTPLAATVSDLSKKFEKLDAHQNEIRDELRKQNQKTDMILQLLMSSQTQNNS